MVTNHKTHPLAMASLATAVFSWLVGGLGTVALVLVLNPFSFCTWVIFLGGSVTAVIFGHQSRSQIRNNDEGQNGERLAAIGLTLGWAGVAINVLLICTVVALAVTAVVLGPQIGDYFPWLVRGLEGFE
ncbi:MAG: DUF4190 domain-containing protein [Anaerolineae bacterium]|jgi:hypothetical protein